MVGNKQRILMGFSLTWVAVRGGTPQAILEHFGLRGTGQREESPEAEITGTELPDGWYLIVDQHDRLRLTDDRVLRELAQSRDVVMCFVEEHVMCSAAAGWRDGERLWSLHHEAGESAAALQIQGRPPAGFDGIRDRLSAQRTASAGEEPKVDYIWDIPVEVAAALTGYRHDQDLPGEPKDAFEILVQVDKPSGNRAWWRRLLGA